MDGIDALAAEGEALDLLRRLGVKHPDAETLMAVRRFAARHPSHDLKSLAKAVREEEPPDPWAALQARYARHGERLVELYRLTYLAERTMRTRLNLALAQSELGRGWHRWPKTYLYNPVQFAQETAEDFGWSFTESGPMLNDELGASRFLDQLSLGHLKNIVVGPRPEFRRQLLGTNGRPIDPNWLESGLRDMVNRRNDFAHFRHMDEGNYEAARSWTMGLVVMMGWTKDEVLAWAPRA